MTACGKVAAQMSRCLNAKGLRGSKVDCVRRDSAMSFLSKALHSENDSTLKVLFLCLARSATIVLWWAGHDMIAPLHPDAGPPDVCWGWEWALDGIWTGDIMVFFTMLPLNGAERNLPGTWSMIPMQAVRIRFFIVWGALPRRRRPIDAASEDWLPLNGKVIPAVSAHV